MNRYTMQLIDNLIEGNLQVMEEVIRSFTLAVDVWKKFI